jgi:hypothetical protein
MGQQRFQMCFSLCDSVIHNTFIQVTQPWIHILYDHSDSKSNSNKAVHIGIHNDRNF